MVKMSGMGESAEKLFNTWKSIALTAAEHKPIGTHDFLRHSKPFFLQSQGKALTQHKPMHLPL